MADIADDDPRLLRLRRLAPDQPTSTPPATTPPATTDMPTLVVTAPNPQSDETQQRLARIQKFQPGSQAPAPIDTTTANTAATGDTIAPNLRAAISQDPNATYAQVWPLKRDASGIHMAWPGGMHDFANGLLDLAEGPITGTVTPQGTNALLSAALAGAKGGPPGFKPSETAYLSPEFRAKPAGDSYKPWSYVGDDPKTRTLVDPPPMSEISREQAENLWRLHNPGKDVPDGMLTHGPINYTTRGSVTNLNPTAPPLYTSINPKTGAERYWTKPTTAAPDTSQYTTKAAPPKPILQSEVSRAAGHLGGVALGTALGMMEGPIGATLGGIIGYPAGEMARALISKVGPWAARHIMNGVGAMGPNALWLTEPQNGVTDMPSAPNPPIAPWDRWRGTPSQPQPAQPPSGNQLLLPQYAPTA